MIQGTGSNVGKSLLVAGLLRTLRARGLSVAPFKPQNMSNNAAATAEGHEIGRAQALQARAAGVTPHCHMNPVLLKPESETGAQIIVQGQRFDTLAARDYAKVRPQLLPKVLESFEYLKARYDLVVVEGAGSPAEINLRDGDIANLGFASAARVPVILAGDIDRGGVIAQIVGTKCVLPPDDQNLIRGFLVNKFRGDPSLFDAGMSAIAAQTGWPSLGLVSWFADAHKLPAEDVLDISSKRAEGISIAVPQLSRIANFDDLDPLKNEVGVGVEIVPPGRPLPGDADLVILLGTKSTVGELANFRQQGWDIDLMAHVRRGGHVVGICGGYQMLGRKIDDVDGIEGPSGPVAALGLLDVETIMTPQKAVRPVTGHQIIDGSAVSGYEIHIGRTTGPSCENPWLMIDGQPEGAQSANGRALGSYVHGMFAEDAFRQSFLRRFDPNHRVSNFGAEIEDVLDALGAHVSANVDVDELLGIAENGL